MSTSIESCRRWDGCSGCCVLSAAGILEGEVAAYGLEGKGFWPVMLGPKVDWVGVLPSVSWLVSVVVAVVVVMREALLWLESSSLCMFRGMLDGDGVMTSAPHLLVAAASGEARGELTGRKAAAITTGAQKLKGGCGSQGCAAGTRCGGARRRCRCVDGEEGWERAGRVDSVLWRKQRGVQADRREKATRGCAVGLKGEESEQDRAGGRARCDKSDGKVGWVAAAVGCWR